MFCRFFWKAPQFPSEISWPLEAFCHLWLSCSKIPASLIVCKAWLKKGNRGESMCQGLNPFWKSWFWFDKWGKRKSQKICYMPNLRSLFLVFNNSKKYICNNFIKTCSNLSTFYLPISMQDFKLWRESNLGQGNIK